MFLFGIAFLLQSPVASSVLSPGCCVQRREEKLSWEHRKNRSLSFIPAPGHTPYSRSCPVKWGWRLLALGIWQKGTTGAEKICGIVGGLSGRVWATWVDDLQVLAAEPSHLYDVWNAVFWKLITFPQTSSYSWVKQKAEISVPEMELHCVGSLLWTLQYEKISNESTRNLTWEE